MLRHDMEVEKHSGRDPYGSGTPASVCLWWVPVEAPVSSATSEREGNLWLKVILGSHSDWEHNIAVKLFRLRRSS